MGRFINLGIAIVNADYIIRVETESSGRAEIYMSDGTMFHCDNFEVFSISNEEDPLCHGLSVMGRAMWRSTG